MAINKETFDNWIKKLQSLRDERQEHLANMEKAWLHWSVLDDARKQIKENFSEKAKDIREDEEFNREKWYYLIEKWIQKLYGENATIKEEIKLESWERMIIIWMPKEDSISAWLLEEGGKYEIVGWKYEIISCPHCGNKENELGAKFCHICWTNLTTGKTADEKEQDEKKEQEKKKQNGKKRKNRRELK